MCEKEWVYVCVSMKFNITSWKMLLDSCSSLQVFSYYWKLPWDQTWGCGNFATSSCESHLSKVSKNWECNVFLQINSSREVALVILWETLKPVLRGRIIVFASDKNKQWSEESQVPKDLPCRLWKQSAEKLKKGKLLLKCSKQQHWINSHIKWKS